MRVQAGSGSSMPSAANWSDGRDAGAIVQALKCLITELIGWSSEPYDNEVEASY